MGGIDFNVVATGLAAPVAVLLIKTLLDLSLSHCFVKYFYWLPVRGLFRDNPQNLSGKWEQVWGAAGSESFHQITHRHSYTYIRQFGCYLYAEFESKGKTYCFFGRVKGSYVTAEWYDKGDKHAYFGMAQLRVSGSSVLEGMYVGHSHKTSLVGSDIWMWSKCG